MKRLHDVTNADQIRLRANCRGLEHRAKLADVARPVVAAQRGERLARDALDDPAVASALARYLGVRGWQTAIAASATELHARGTDDVQLLVLDMRLPDATGTEVLAELRRNGNDVAVVVVSGYLDARTTMEAMRLGALDVLEKPVDTRYLEAIMRRAVERHGEQSEQSPASPLVGRSRPMQLLREQIAKVASFRDLPVLIIGESGTGKELVARALHEQSRPQGPLVAINCAAMPEALFESELFGHAPGAFTGAKGAHAGLLEAAGRGTVLLDEIGEMPAPLQAKLLRVLETQRFRRVGSSEDVALRARIVSATNRLVRGAPTDALRPDLYFRLAGYTVLTPPLRTRMSDIEELVVHFLAAFRATHAHAPVGDQDFPQRAHRRSDSITHVVMRGSAAGPVDRDGGSASTRPRGKPPRRSS